jgi:ubiquitin-protein ligase E3 A
MPKIKIFDKTMIYLMNDKALDDDSFDTICSCLFNTDYFPFILSKNQDPIIHKNMCLFDDLPGVARFLSANIRQFRPLSPMFMKMFNRILNSNPNTHFHLRALILFFAFDCLLSHPAFLSSLVPHIAALPPPSASILWSTLKTVPGLAKHILQSLQDRISSFALKEDVHSDESRALLVGAGKFLASVASISASPLAALSNEALTSKLDPQHELDLFSTQQQSLLEAPLLLTLRFKHKVVARARSAARSASSKKIKIDRGNLVISALSQIAGLSPEELVGDLRITFRHEPCVDEGGPRREFFALLVRAAFSPDYGMFVDCGRFFWFNIFSADYAMFRLLGTVVALCIYNGVVLPIRFPLLLYKKILNQRIEIEDIAELDRDFVCSYGELEGMARRGEDVGSVMLFFSKTVERFGERFEVDLLPGGRDIAVVSANLEQFKERYVDWVANGSVAAQFGAFAEGFAKIGTSQLFGCFAAAELDVIVSGEEALDWDGLRASARYDGYDAGHRTVGFFWDVFGAAEDAQKRRFLLFVTGNDRAPVGGLRKVKIRIRREGEPPMLPVAHTCFNAFDLPPYPTLEMTKEKVLKALEFSEGFGLE